MIPRHDYGATRLQERKKATQGITGIGRLATLGTIHFQQCRFGLFVEDPPGAADRGIAQKRKGEARQYPVGTDVVRDEQNAPALRDGALVVLQANDFHMALEESAGQPGQRENVHPLPGKGIPNVFFHQPPQFPRRHVVAQQHREIAADMAPDMGRKEHGRHDNIRAKPVDHADGHPAGKDEQRNDETPGEKAGHAAVHHPAIVPRRGGLGGLP